MRTNDPRSEAEYKAAKAARKAELDALQAEWPVGTEVIGRDFEGYETEGRIVAWGRGIGGVPTVRLTGGALFFANELTRKGA